jgi:DNA (cytosine-5)-methyltransferase 1
MCAPEYQMGGEFIKAAPDLSERHRLYDWYIDERIGGICNHASRTHLDTDLIRYLFAACFAKIYGRSPRLYEFPKEILPEHKNAEEGLFDDRFRVQMAGRPAMTITSHIAKDGHSFIHYDPLQCRALTVREAARLQTFPDNYLFCGPRTAQYVQVGNAVPPLLAKQIAELIYGILTAEGIV